MKKILKSNKHKLKSCDYTRLLDNTVLLLNSISRAEEDGLKTETKEKWSKAIKTKFKDSEEILSKLPETEFKKVFYEKLSWLNIKCLSVIGATILIIFYF